MDKLLTISQAAEQLGVNQKTLRSWADKGLVPHTRLPSGYRRFSIEQVEEIKRGMLEGKAAAPPPRAANSPSVTRA
jgi:excisionase family DNA binding protein